ncbi:glycine cleavage system protein T, partial [Pseudomonas ogarae]
TLRLEAGMNLYGQDIHQAVSPLASHMARSIPWEPASRPFIGRRASAAYLPSGAQRTVAGRVWWMV